MSVFKYYLVRIHNKVSTYYISKSMKNNPENKRYMMYISFIHHSHGKIMVSSESSEKYILVPVPHNIFPQTYPPAYLYTLLLTF